MMYTDAPSGDADLGISWAQAILMLKIESKKSVESVFIRVKQSVYQLYSFSMETLLDQANFVSSWEIVWNGDGDLVGSKPL